MIYLMLVCRWYPGRDSRGRESGPGVFVLSLLEAPVARQLEARSGLRFALTNVATIP